MDPDVTQPSTAPGEPSPGFVIEELSRRTGVTVRSLRSYQSRKLLPPPLVRGRTGYYDDHHVARVRLIQDLQAEGLKLDGIARMLESAGRSDADLLQFTRSVRELFGEGGANPVVTAAELARRFGVGEGSDEGAAGLLDKAVRLGVLRHLGGDTYEEVAPRLLDAGEAASRVLGLDAADALGVVSALRKHADGVAGVYVDLFLSRIWEPFLDAGQPQERWPEVQQSLDEVRSLATEALVAAFEMVMAERVNEVFGRELGRPRRGGRKRG